MSPAAEPPPGPPDSSVPSANSVSHLNRAGQVFLVFLRLGLTSFGGPVAHLGYFRTAFVQQRRWLSENDYADLVALCQLLPGPASSQVGMAIGLQRAGGWGALAAWAGFTLPSAALLVALAFGLGDFPQLAGSGVVRGLKLAAVAVVAQAVWGMGRTLCRGWPRMALAALAAAMVLLLPTAATQVAVIVVCAAAGVWLLPAQGSAPVTVSDSASDISIGHTPGKRAGWIALWLHLASWSALSVAAFASGELFWQLASGFYRAGSLVFGGGHVVLPLLQATVVPVGVISNAEFLAGYGATQAVPGPLFSFAAYLGAMMPDVLPRGWGALIFLVLLFLPAFLILLAALPLWNAARQRPGVRAAMSGINAGVVGILLAALYNPVFVSAVHGPPDLAVAAAGFLLLTRFRYPPVLVVGLCALAGAFMPHMA